jgi:hypothetical protein
MMSTDTLGMALQVKVDAADEQLAIANRNLQGDAVTSGGTAY